MKNDEISLRKALGLTSKEAGDLKTSSEALLESRDRSLREAWKREDNRAFVRRIPSQETPAPVNKRSWNLD